jgi:amino acid transporter
MSRINLAPVVGAAIASGAISTVIIIAYGFIARDAAEMFWQTISFSAIVGLFSYLVLFPAFIILRIKDKAVKRPYRVPGPEWFGFFLAIMAAVLFWSPLSVLMLQPGSDFARTALPTIIGIIITVILGEILVARSLGNPES